MTDSVLSFLEQAFRNADDCYATLDDILDKLDNAVEALPEGDVEIRELITQMSDKTFAFQDSMRSYLEDLRTLRLKYRSAYIPSAISPEVDELTDVLARIEARRRGLKLQE